MDLGSPENAFEDLNDLLKDDDSSLVGELGLNFIVSKEDNILNYGFDNLTKSNEFCANVNEQGQQDLPSLMNEQNQQATPSLPSDFPYYDFPGSPEKFQSPLESGYNIVSLCETNDEELLQSNSKDYYEQEETEEICCSYLSEFPPQVESATSQHGNESEVMENLVESPPRQAATEGIEMGNKPASSLHEAMGQGQGHGQGQEQEPHDSFMDVSAYESVKSDSVTKQVEEEVLEHSAEILYTSPRSHVDKCEIDTDHFPLSRISPVESRKLEVSLNPSRSPQVSPSPNRVKQMSITADMSPGSEEPFSQKILDSHGQRQCSSPIMFDIANRIEYSLPSGKKDPASPLRSQESKRLTGDSSSKQSSISPKNYHVHENDQRRFRTRSKSPTRRKESYSRQKAKYYDRSRSRSPYKREYHGRSPRRRHSLRRKSPPPSDYHLSRRRSPRRKPWSPPHNRSTGLGKPGRILFVAGFNFLTTERDLDRKFSRFGRVQDVRIARDKRSGDSRGFGFITLERDEEADAAIRALDKTEWNGRIVLVEKSKSH